MIESRGLNTAAQGLGLILTIWGLAGLISETWLVLARASTSRRSSLSHGFPCIAAWRLCSVPASIAS